MGRKITVQRQELYEAVWEEPVSRMADEYGVSGRGLKKICARLDVPTPPRGWWAKKQHGHDVERPPLPPLEEGTPTSHVIPYHRKRDKEHSESEKPDPKPSAEVVPPPKVKVLSRLRSPHPLVEHTRRALKETREDRYGRLQPRDSKALSLNICQPSTGRALRILDTLVKATEKAGYEVRPGKGRQSRAHLIAGEEKLEFRITERTSREKNELKESERSLWDPKYTYHPTGKLRLVMYHENTEMKTWRDTKRSRVEEKLGKFIAYIPEAIRRVEERRREREEFRRRLAEEEKRRREKAEARRREERRRESLEQEAQRWEKSQRLVGYIDEVERQLEVKDLEDEVRSQSEEWLVWAREHATRLDPLSDRLPFE